MLRATFQHFPGIGATTEAELWRAGYRDWRELLDHPERLAADLAGRRRLADEVAASERALVARDAHFFARRLAEGEHWRAYPEFARETAYLDIETTGLSPFQGIVTVVTVHGGGATRSFIAGEDLEELPAYLRRFGVLVTFNGRRFDVPFLAVTFPQLIVPPLHIDLRFLFYRLGIAGGLKRIEERLGIGDRSGVEGIQGPDAVRLWQEYRRGNAAALDRLVRYNRADTVNLEPLLERAVRDLRTRLLARPPSAGPDPGPDPAGS